MSTIQPILGGSAQTEYSLPRGNGRFRLRMLGNRIITSLRSNLFDPRDVLAGDSPSAIALRPNSNEATSLATRIRYDAEKLLPYRTQPLVMGTRSTGSPVTHSCLASQAEEGSALNPWTALREGPKPLSSTTDGKQITRQSKSPPPRQSLRRTQSQPPGKSKSIQLRRGQPQSESQQESQRF